MLKQESTPHTAEPQAEKKRDRTPRRATPTQRLLTGTQIAGIRPAYRSVYDLYLSGKLPAVRFKEGGRLWFRREDVERLIASSVELHPSPLIVMTPHSMLDAPIVDWSITREQDVIRWALEREVIAPIDNAQDFGRDAHVIIWNTILRLRSEGRATDYLTVRDEFDAR